MINSASCTNRNCNLILMIYNSQLPTDEIVYIIFSLHKKVLKLNTPKYLLKLNTPIFYNVHI